MNQMFKAQKLKITACALTGLMTFGLVGMTESSAEARSWHPDKPHYQELAHKHHRYHEKTKSQGDVNTAAIVGAVVGAVIAKNT